MSDVTLILGPVAFQDFEVASGVNFGGRQRLALHRLPGGSRVIDALGRDDAQISFSGIFSGSDATLRARSLDQLRVVGVALPLTWDVLFYTVLIAEFQASYRNGWWIPYRIVCTVLRDEASALVQLAASLATTALADIGAASGYALNAGLDLSPLQAALATPGATTRGTAAYSAAQECLVGTKDSISSSISITNATLMGATIVGAGSAEAAAANLLAATDAAGQLTSLVSAGSYISRTETNLTNAST
ncbi:MAG: hypothetical protein WA864_19375 [Acetobacteraceae bacterium]|jgi:hypothetical protein